MFLLSLYSDFTKISDDYKLDAKADIINVIKNYKSLSNPSQPSTSSSYAFNFSGYTTASPHPSSYPHGQTTHSIQTESQQSSYENVTSEDSIITNLF